MLKVPMMRFNSTTLFTVEDARKVEQLAKYLNGRTRDGSRTVVARNAVHIELKEDERTLLCRILENGEFKSNDPD